MQVQPKVKIDLKSNIQVVIADIERQIRELDEKRAELVASLKAHQKMLKLAMNEKVAIDDETSQGG